MQGLLKQLNNSDLVIHILSFTTPLLCFYPQNIKHPTSKKSDES